MCTSGGWKTKLLPLQVDKMCLLYCELGRPNSVSLHGNWLFLAFYNEDGGFDTWLLLYFHNYVTGETKTYNRAMAATLEPGTLLMWGAETVQKLVVPLDDSPMPQPQTLYRYLEKEVEFHRRVYNSQCELLLFDLMSCHLRWLGDGQDEGLKRFTVEVDANLVPRNGKAMETNPQKKLIRTLDSKVRTKPWYAYLSCTTYIDHTFNNFLCNNFVSF